MIKLINILPQDNKRTSPLHLIAAGLFLLMFAFPIFPLKVTNVVFILFCVSTFVAYIHKPVPVKGMLLKNLVFLLPFVPYLIEWVISGFNPVVTFEIEKKLFLFMAFPFIPLFVQVTGFKNYRWPLTVFALSVGALCLYSFSLLILSGVPFADNVYENGSFILRHHFEDISGLQSTYYTAFALAAAYFLFRFSAKGKGFIRVGGYVLSALLFLSVLYLAVRIAYITVGVFLVVSIFSLTIKSWKKWVLAVLVPVLMLAAGWGIPSLRSRLGEFTWMQNDTINAHNTMSQRSTIATCAWEVFGDNLLFGTGCQHIHQELSACYASGGWELGADKKFNPHNQYLSMGISFGLGGLILFLVCLFIIFRKIFRYPEGKYFVLILVLFFLTESMLERAMGVYFFGLLGMQLYLVGDEVPQD